MASRIGVSNLNASTIDILNVIRENASLAYQNEVPVIESVHDIPKVGDCLYGYPALANEFINALVNRIALVRVKSATFNNAYKELKKGYLEYGETVEEVFVAITKAREFSVEKAEQREFKRSLPDVRAAFHTMNYRVQYPITIQDEDLRKAFVNAEGVRDLIAKIVDAVYVAAEYDEYLLFKYLMIKAITKGKMKPVEFNPSDIKNAAKKFRGASNALTFMSTEYNASGVTTSTPKEDQYIFMDSWFNADFDVDVLAGAFNMDKADFMGKLKLIDSWTTFDNDRFSVIRENSDGLEEVTEDELRLMENVKAVLVDKEWFQIYDHLEKFTEKYVASGMYWNYFLNVWKTISSSPFSNAVVFVDGPTEAKFTNIDFTVDANNYVPLGDGKFNFALSLRDPVAYILLNGQKTNKTPLAMEACKFIPTSGDTGTIANGVGVKPYGLIIGTGKADLDVDINVVYNGATFGSNITAQDIDPNGGKYVDGATMTFVV